MDFNKLIKKIFDNFNKKDKDKNKKQSNKKLNNKIIFNLVVVFLIGVLMLITASFFNSSNNKTKSTLANKDYKEKEGEEKKCTSKDEETEKQLRYDLKNILQQTEGVGRVEVMIYFESGEEQVPAVNINNSTNSAIETDTAGGKRNTTQTNKGEVVVITNEGENKEPLIVKKNKPKVTGVLIVAEGAEEKITEYRIKKAVKNLFQIADNKVNVYPMKK